MKAIEQSEPIEDGKREELRGDRPDLTRLKADFEWFVNNRPGRSTERARINYDTRYTRWAGQSADGRKWAVDKTGNIFPWKGASDARVPLVDLYCNWQVALLMAAWKRNQVGVRGVESNDAAYGVRMTNYLRWLIYGQMDNSEGETAADEMELAANYLCETGKVVMQVTWERSYQNQYEEYGAEEIQQVVQEALKYINTPQFARLPRENQERLIRYAQLPQLIADPAREEMVTDLVREFLPDLSAADARQMVVDLRQTGTARVVRASMTANRPRWQALQVGVDVFLPPEGGSLQKARAIAVVEIVSETTLRERIFTHQYDPKWVDEVIEKQRGNMNTTLQNGQLVPEQRSWQGSLTTSQVFQILHMYYRRYDTKGVPGIYYTCFHGGIMGRAAWHGLLDYAHGKYPFLLCKRENISRLTEESRGLGEIAATWQRTIKNQWDSRTDRTSTATLPPAYFPPDADVEQWGPGARIPTNTPDRYGFMKVPDHDPGSEEIEATTRRFADQYNGIPTSEEDKALAALLKQLGIDKWMGFCKRICTQTLQLAQQFGDDDIYYRVVGSNQGQALHMSREDIQGEFDVVMSFNVADTDPAERKQKSELLREAMAFDRGGALDPVELLRVVLESTDPNLAERLIQPREVATKRMKEEMDKTVAFAALGNEPDEYPKLDPAAEIKSGMLNQIIKSNPSYQNLLASQTPAGERFREILQNLEKSLQQSVVQLRENPTAGLEGVKRLGAG